MNQLYNVAILGCGWAGILLSLKLKKMYGDSGVVCVEGEHTPGGLLKTDSVNGFTVDVGGSHVIFSRNKNVFREMLGFLKGNYLEHHRKSYVLLDGLFIPYPFENGLYVLPPEERAEALVDFIESLLSLDVNWRPRNLMEWIYRFFGKWIARKYLIPYNKKIWKRSLEEIDVDWIYTPGRLPIPDWRDVVRSAVGIPTRGYKEQAVFYYPLKGGIMALYNSVYEEAISDGVHVVVGHKVDSVLKQEGSFKINNKIEARRVYSTIPLPELVEALGLSDHLSTYMDFFDYNRVAVVAVALNKQAPDQHWVYVPDEGIIFHRYAWISSYSPNNAPQGKSLVVAEITIPKNSSIEPSEIVDHVVKGFEKIGVFEEKDVIFTKIYINEYGYPIHRIGLKEARRVVLEELAKLGIISIGRWGAWKYMNMDMVLEEVNTILNNLGSGAVSN